MLKELIARRQQRPTEPWLESFMLAWNDAGSPRLSFHPSWIHLSDSNGSSAVELRERVRGTADELLLAGELRLSGEEIIRLALSSSAATTAPMRILAFTWLSQGSNLGLPPELEQAAEARRKQLTVILANDFPDDMYFPVREVLDAVGTSAAIPWELVSRLSAAVKWKPFGPPRWEMYEEYKRRFLAMGANEPELRAASVVRIVDIDTIHRDVLEAIERVSQNATPGVRTALADALARLGWAYLERGTLMHWLSGCVLLESSGRLLESSGEATESGRRVTWAEFLRSYALLLLYRSHGAAFAFTDWPITPLRREGFEALMRDEMAVLQSFAQIDLSYESWLRDLEITLGEARE